MPFLSEKDRATLKAILDSSSKILGFTKRKRSATSFYDDELVYDATLMNFIIIGESVAKLSSAIKSRHPEIQWNKIKGFRNLITHDYIGVNPEMTWQIVRNQLPELRKEIASLIKKYS